MFIFLRLSNFLFSSIGPRDQFLAASGSSGKLASQFMPKERGRGNKNAKSDARKNATTAVKGSSASRSISSSDSSIDTANDDNSNGNNNSEDDDDDDEAAVTGRLTKRSKHAAAKASSKSTSSSSSSSKKSPDISKVEAKIMALAKKKVDLFNEAHPLKDEDNKDEKEGNSSSSSSRSKSSSSSSRKRRRGRSSEKKKEVSEDVAVFFDGAAPYDLPELPSETASSSASSGSNPESSKAEANSTTKIEK